MAGGYRVSWNASEFDRILNQQTVPQAVWRAAGRVRDRAKQNITAAGRIDTGALRNSIVGRRVRQGGRGVWYEVGSDLHYAIHQHEGVAGPIVPRRAKVLRFKPKGSGAFVFRPRTSGFKGEPFLVDALRSLTINDFAP